jgi:hypothetical protein
MFILGIDRRTKAERMLDGSLFRVRPKSQPHSSDFFRKQIQHFEAAIRMTPEVIIYLTKWNEAKLGIFEHTGPQTVRFVGNGRGKAQDAIRPGDSIEAFAFSLPRECQAHPTSEYQEDSLWRIAY